MTSETPYQAPNAEVINHTDGSPVLHSEPVSCSAGEGWTWVKEGFASFRSNPGIWLGMIVVYMILMVVMGFIPFIGSLATFFLGPVFTGGLMIACQNMENDQGSFGDLFSGFRENFGSLVLLGVMYFGFLMIPMMGLFAFGLGGMFLEGDPAMLENPEAFGMSFVLGILFFIALIIPLAMGMWFAPALIVFHELSPWNAFKTSFKGCIKNIIPLLVYGVITLILAIVAVIPLFLGMLVFAPTMIGSIYSAYKMIFRDE